MHPPLWQPPVELSLKEQEIISRIRHAKLFIFLRQIRHQLFDEHVQSELAQIYTDTAKGNPPIPPAQLALFNYPASVHGSFRRRSDRITADG